MSNHVAFVVLSSIAIMVASAEYQTRPGGVNVVPGGGGIPAINRQGPVFIPIVRDDRTQNSQGEYKFAYEGADGTQRQEAGTQNDGQIVQGGWSYTSPEGIPVQITFIADQGGYQPQGNVLPVAPPLPYQREQQFLH